LRDPTIMKHSDGKYYVAHTTNSWTTTTNNFAIASSSDLVKWTNVVTVEAQVANVKDTWAPEWFKDDSDGSINLIVNIDTGNSDFRAYKFTATDNTLTKWSAPVTIGIGPNYIDTFIVKVGDTYNAFSKNETTKYIEHATAPSLMGPWTWGGKDDWAGWGSGKEGPALFQLDNGQWRIFLDCYGNCGYLYSTSTDLKTWSSTAEVPKGLSGVVRHGTVLREDDTADAGVVDSGSREVGEGDSSADVAGRDSRSSDTASDTTPSDVAIGSGGSGDGGKSGSGGVSGSGGRSGAGGATGSGGKSGSGGSSSASGGANGAGGSAGSSGQADASPVRDASGSGGQNFASGSGGQAGASAPSSTTGSSKGCTCRVGSVKTDPPWYVLVALAALVVRAVRRRIGAQRQ
jgi:MYXO-CTERM domain-containing protein